MHHLAPAHIAEITTRDYPFIDPEQTVGRQQQSERPLNVVFLTSIRDVGRDDQVGKHIQTPTGPRYMMGLIEAFNEAINQNLFDLNGMFRLSGVITDDLRTEHVGFDYDRKPKTQGRWIHPIDMENDEGERVSERTHLVPSDFRAIPKTPERKDEREEARQKFESQLFKTCKDLNADIIVSDHLMVILRDILQTARVGIGRILNMHPAITDTTNPHRLPGATPTQDALDRINHGAIYNRKTGLYEITQRHFKTGASLHVIDRGIDTGPIIADSESTPVFPTDTPETLRLRNYTIKIITFILGLKHYAQEILPNLTDIDLRTKRATKNTPELAIIDRDPTTEISTIGRIKSIEDPDNLERAQDHVFQELQDSGIITFH